MEPLPDPLEDRVVKDILSPPFEPLTKELLFPNKGKKIKIILLRWYTGLAMPSRSFNKRRKIK
jgi:hypothetical protein